MSSKDEFYIPQVRDDKKPKAGIAFKSLDETYEFYNDYARMLDLVLGLVRRRKRKKQVRLFGNDTFVLRKVKQMRRGEKKK
ncbi:unnamed protein product, partial [Prunus brigantina]